MLARLRAQRRAFDIGAALFCFAMFGFALFLQWHQGLNPCPLCIFQRIAVVGLGCAFLIAAAIPQRFGVLRTLSSGLIALVALAGTGVAARQVYLRSLPPDRDPVCGATLDYMMEIFSPAEVLRKVLTGSGECAKVDWDFLGVTMPGWVLILVVVLGTAGVLVNRR